MATYNYVTNSIEETGLTLATADMNAQPHEGLPDWTNQTLLSILVGEVLQNQALRFQYQILTEAIAKYPTVAADKQAGVLAKLGLSAISPLAVQDQIPILANLGMARFNGLSQSDKLEVFSFLGL